MSGRTVHDGYFLPPLVKQTAQNFEVKEVSADKAYLSHKNMETIEALGGTPFIPFKATNVQPKDDSNLGDDVPLLHVQPRDLPKALPQAL
jgi:hypothetical protein